jgi:hypothetical protein
MKQLCPSMIPLYHIEVTHSYLLTVSGQAFQPATLAAMRSKISAPATWIHMCQANLPCTMLYPLSIAKYQTFLKQCSLNKSHFIHIDLLDCSGLSGKFLQSDVSNWRERT